MVRQEDMKSDPGVCVIGNTHELLIGPITFISLLALGMLY